MKRILLVACVATCLVLSSLRGASPAEINRLFGVYPAVVVNAQDPMQRGRLLLKLPVVSTTAEAWALASAPYVDGTMGSIRLPPPSSEVWVQFEAGDPSKPVWVGWKPR
jgi:uncharacterized protein involved in type VI secretion and phage assembly